MGFPQRNTEEQGAAVHVGSEVALMAGGYTCPRCKGRSKELPSECHVCGLTLIASPHLARSYHHLFPVLPFEELTAEAICRLAHTTRPGGERGGSLACFGCTCDLSPAVEAARRAWEQQQQQQQAEASASGRDLPTRTQQQQQASLAAPMVLQCGACRKAFCFDCDTYVHESLHNCPGCEISPEKLGGQG